ncbi:MAG TPA: aldehyde dehydrogenase family protein [Egibacteraceae bacterium]|jgi:acyl-CoA reductase-like NAD-dependent aldehyde dehydrogenase|nr:aldehyde dehydrogenase family protein [Egibacteraceae bacterium]
MTRHHFIDGTSTPGFGEKTIPVVDPATGRDVGAIPAGGPGEADAAVAAARKAAPGWARAPTTSRAAALKAAARAVRACADELAQLQTAENGKPLGMSRGDVETAAATFEQFAELGPLHRGRSLHGDWGALDAMVHEPYGVAALVVPWNDPLGLAAQMLAATLVAGNTVVLKPSERTPLATARLVELLDLPAGVCNLLLGDGRAGEPLVEHPDVDLVLHTGSVATGRRIAEACGRQLKKAVVELGGKDPLVVDAGVDPRWAAEQAAQGAFANCGQICTAVERIYVHADVADAFVDALVERAEELVVGDGREPGTDMGPLVDARQRNLVHRHVTEAVHAGAILRTGGVIPDGPGFFYPPTVLTGVTDDMAVMREETFGPVAPVRVTASFAEAVEAANRTEYGLAATVLTASQAHAQEAWRELRAGTVKVNAVWGGAPGGAAQPQKASGLGYGYGPELLDEVTTTKVVHYRPAGG